MRLSMMRILAVPAAMLAAAAPAGAGSYEICSMLRLRDIIPGTEQVALVSNGGFEEGDKDWKPHTGWGPSTIGPPVVPVPGVCGRMVMRAEANKPKAASRQSPFGVLEGDCLYVFSNYIWMPGDDAVHYDRGAVGIPGEQHIWHAWPAQGCDGRGYSDGFYLFGEFKPLQRQVGKPNIVDCKAGRGTGDGRYGYRDEKGNWETVTVMWDNVAVTPVTAFAPPALRHAVAAEFQAIVGFDPAARADRSVAALRKAVEAAPGDFRCRNRLAAACMVEFAAGLSRYDSYERALAEWRASLSANPDQPDVRWWLKRYGGYRPPAPVPAPGAPPPAVLAAHKPDPAGDVNDPGTMLRLRDILPGTERVTLVPGGDFEGGAAGWTPHDGRAPMKAGPLAVTAGTPVLPPAGFDSEVLYAEVPAAEPWAGMDSPPLALEPDTEYVFSAYVWVLGDDASHYQTFAIGLEGQQHVWWGWPAEVQSDGKGEKAAAGIQQGIFIYGWFRPDGAHLRCPVSLRAGAWTGDKPPYGFRDAGGGFRRVGIAVDRVAVTKASEFRPPALRASSQLEFRSMLEKQGDLAAAIQRLEAETQTKPDDFRCRNSLGAACMAAHLCDMSRADLFTKALAAWRESMKINPDQPNVARWLDLWSGYRPGAPPRTANFFVERAAPGGRAGDGAASVPAPVTGGCLRLERKG